MSLREIERALDLEIDALKDGTNVFSPAARRQEIGRLETQIERWHRIHDRVARALKEREDRDYAVWPSPEMQEALAEVIADALVGENGD